MHAILDAIKSRRPRILPDAPGLLVQSIGREGVSLINKQAIEPWAQALQDQVARNGKWRQFDVWYVPVSPPPGLYEYACRGCRFYQPENGCVLVEGFIAKGGWCVTWVPPAGAKALRWPMAIPGHLIGYAKEAPRALLSWIKGGGGSPATGATARSLDPSNSNAGGPTEKERLQAAMLDVTFTPAPETPPDQIKTQRF